MVEGIYKVDLPQGPATVTLSDCNIRTCTSVTSIRVAEGGGFGYQRVSGECEK